MDYLLRDFFCCMRIFVLWCRCDVFSCYCDGLLCVILFVLFPFVLLICFYIETDACWLCFGFVA